MCSIHEAWEIYLETTVSKEDNLRNDRYRYNLHIVEYWNGKSLEQVKMKDILTYKKHLTEKGLSPKTIAHCLSLLRTIMYRAKQFEIFDGTIPHFTMPKYDNKRIRYLTTDEATNLLTALYMRNELWHDITLFALNTGMRASEIFSIKTEHINFSQGTITLFETKNGSNRTIPLNDVTFSIAQKYASKNFTFLFSNNKIRDVSYIFRSVVKELKLNHNITERRNQIVFHSLRHTFASWLVQAGVALAVVSSLLGHKSLQMTMRYAHLAPEQGKHAISLIPNNISIFYSQEKNS